MPPPISERSPAKPHLFTPYSRRYFFCEQLRVGHLKTEAIIRCEEGWPHETAVFCGGDIDRGTTINNSGIWIGQHETVVFDLGMPVRAVCGTEGFGLCDGRPHGSRGVGQWRHRLQLHG